MYTNINFQTKKALKAAVANGQKVSVWQPGPFPASNTECGKVCVEGPHYPQPHKWYAEVWLEDGYIERVQ